MRDTATPARLVAQSVSKRYHRAERRHLSNFGRRQDRAVTWALRNVDLEVADGEVVGVIGTNGSGKSTLLRLLAGLTGPSEGHVRTRGSVHGLLDLGENLNPLLTGEENARSDLILSGVSSRDSTALVEWIADFSELEGQLDQPLRTYSQGMRLRLAFATATAVVPDILLVDELLAVGDGHFRERCLRRLGELRDAGSTIVLTSHDVDHVTRLCNRAIWLVDGQVRAEGDAGEVADLYQGLLRESDLALISGPEGADESPVSLRQVELQHHGGGRARRIQTGAGIEIVVDYEVSGHVGSAIIEVAVHAEGASDAVIEVNTDTDDQLVAVEPGPHRLTVQLERVDLVKGSYHVDVGVFTPDWSTTLAYSWQAASFEVAGDELTGIIAPPRRWSVG